MTFEALFGIRKAIQELVPTPQLLPPHILAPFVKKALKRHNATWSLDDESLHGAMYSFGQLLVTALDTESHSLRGIYCLPKITSKNTYLVAKPIARGHFDRHGLAYARPNLPAKILISFDSLHGLHGGSIEPANVSLGYAQIEHCTRQLGAVRLCNADVPSSSYYPVKC